MPSATGETNQSRRGAWQLLALTTGLLAYAILSLFFLSYANLLRFIEGCLAGAFFVLLVSACLFAWVKTTAAPQIGERLKWLRLGVLKWVILPGLLLGYAFLVIFWWSRPDIRTAGGTSSHVKSYRAFIKPADQNCLEFIVEEQATIKGFLLYQPQTDDYSLNLPPRRIRAVESGFLSKRVVLSPLQVDAQEDQGLHLDGLFDWSQMSVDASDVAVTVFDLPSGTFYQAKDKTAEITDFDQQETATWSPPRVTRDRKIQFTFVPPRRPWYWWLVKPAIGVRSLGELATRLLGALVSAIFGLAMIGLLLKVSVGPWLGRQVIYWWKRWRAKETRLRNIVEQVFIGQYGSPGKPRLRGCTLTTRKEDAKYDVIIDLNSIWHEKPFSTKDLIQEDMVKLYCVIYRSNLGISQVTIRSYLLCSGAGLERVLYQTSLKKEVADRLDWDSLSQTGLDNCWNTEIDEL
jgi:hypothetical protein